jgi:hypothetical protein
MGCTVAYSGIEITTYDGGELGLRHVHNVFQFGGGLFISDISTLQRGGGWEVNV